MQVYEIVYRRHFETGGEFRVVTSLATFTARTEREADSKMKRKVRGLCMTSVSFAARPVAQEKADAQ